MTDAAYLAWGERHLTAFGMLTDQNGATVLQWREIFEAAQADPAEMDLATRDLLASDNPPRFLSEHPSRLLRAIRGRRAVDLDAPADDRPTCPMCAGSGRLIVPHLAAVRAGHWVGARTGAAAAHYTQAVRCPCERGQFGRFTARSGASLMTLAEYETRNPAWERQLAQRQRELTAEAGQGQADAYDAALQRIRERFAALQETTAAGEWSGAAGW